MLSYAHAQYSLAAHITCELWCKGKSLGLPFSTESRPSLARRWSLCKYSVRSFQEVEMSVAVANATNQYVFRRNFSTRKWESLAGSGGTCRIQVLKKAGAVDYTLRIFPEQGEVCHPISCSQT